MFIFIPLKNKSLHLNVMSNLKEKLQEQNNTKNMYSLCLDSFIVNNSRNLISLTICVLSLSYLCLYTDINICIYIHMYIWLFLNHLTALYP